MQVSIKSFDVQMDVKAKGVEFEFRSPDGKEFLGDCYLTMSGLIWCKGKQDKKNGQKINWPEFIALMGDSEALKSAVKQARRSK